MAAVAGAVFLVGMPDRTAGLIDSGICAVTGGDCLDDTEGDASPSQSGPDSQGGSDETSSPEGGGDWPESPAASDDPEAYQAQPLIYQPDAGNGVTPTYASYDAANDASVQTVADDGDGGRGDDFTPYETEHTENGTAGTDPDDLPDNGLGPLSEGTSVDGELHPPEWTPPAPETEWGSDEPTEDDEDLHAVWERRAFLARMGLGNAASNMAHYLGNSGEPHEQDVNDMLDSVDRFSEAVELQQDRLVQEAIDQALAEGGEGPYTFPVNTDWSGHRGSQDEDGNDWYLASGSWDYSQTGQVTVAQAEDGTWSYQIETEIHMRDQYDWHPGLTAPVPFIGITPDAELARLAEAGLAQEFLMYGTSDVVTRGGTYTEEDGLVPDTANGPGTDR
ncbi:hypothetical protein O4J56_10580 [Nocardiopsis sp. RSe5-2]|uniref:Uncharacterized protein n=1 Tax=Nocardiopsis endophytica TaxID=3018445 RepID=A0ABT4U2A8_9ACTN|nr:hypothetical protein [Nocardiopsis endophytica]MDA2811082.1 hypothetical protein [Nocardiopsis endophytica]